MNRARILVAENKYNSSVISGALSMYFVLLAGCTDEAHKLLLEDRIDLFVIGFTFDDYRGPELAIAVRLDATKFAAPILLISFKNDINSLAQRDVCIALRDGGLVSEYLEFETSEHLREQLANLVEAHLPHRLKQHTLAMEPTAVSHKLSSCNCDSKHCHAL